MDEDDELSDESFGQWCVDEPLDELEDESFDEVPDEPLLELDELVDVEVGAFEAANACPAPTPPMTAADASMLARTARRIFEAIAASPPFAAVAHVGPSRPFAAGNPR